MIRVALCDDDPVMREKMASLWKEAASEFQVMAELAAFPSGEALLSSPVDFDLLFLDVEMEGMNGIETARVLRRRGKNTVIVLVTNYVQYAIDGYEVQAFHFLCKPVSSERFREVVKKALRILDMRAQRMIQLRGDDEILSVPVRKILCCETSQRHVLVHLEEGTKRCFSSLNALEKELSGQGFFRCHSSFLINMESVEALLPQEVRLKNKMVIPVSKYRKKAFREGLMKYWGERFL